jgi:hypothetical protein
MKTTIKCAAWTSKKFTPKIKPPLRGTQSGRAQSGRQKTSRLMKNRPRKSADIRRLPAEVQHTSPSLIVERVVFTAGEHLGAQQQIERRAHELWCAGGCRHGTTLSDWLQAESEVLEQFTWAYARRHALRQSSVMDVKCSPACLRGCARRPSTSLNTVKRMKICN